MKIFKRFSFIYTMSAFLLITSFQHSIYAIEESVLVDQENDKYDHIPTLKTTEECILWFGCNCPHKDNYNPKSFSKKDSEYFFEEGLSYLKKQKNKFCSETLAGYYADKKDMSKALYWAHIGAENGSSNCMGMLRWAYCNGFGVVADDVETVKWTYLAAAKGAEEEKKMLKEAEETAIKNKYVEKILQESRKKAKEWIENHREAFFDPS